MKFTNDDLYELKHSMTEGCRLPNKLSLGRGAISKQYVQAILARLEAAEKALELNYSDGAPGYEDTMAYKAWLESKGEL